MQSELRFKQKQIVENKEQEKQNCHVDSSVAVEQSEAEIEAESGDHAGIGSGS